jgi:hypothetical protein
MTSSSAKPHRSEFDLKFGQNLFLSPEFNGELVFERSNVTRARTVRVTRRTPGTPVQHDLPRGATVRFRWRSRSESHNIDQIDPAALQPHVQYSFSRNLTKEPNITLPDYHECKRPGR